jgi:hypothetical protein
MPLSKGSTFVYDAKTSSFVLPGAPKASPRDESKPPQDGTAKSSGRQLRRPDQFIYSAKTSSFFLLGDQSPIACPDSLEDDERESGKVSSLQREVEKQRLCGQRSGSLVSLQESSKLDFVPGPSSTQSSSELHSFMSNFLPHSDQQEPERAHKMDTRAQALAPSATKATDALRQKGTGEAEGGTDIAPATADAKALLDFYKTRTKVLEGRLKISEDATAAARSLSLFLSLSCARTHIRTHSLSLSLSLHRSLSLRFHAAVNASMQAYGAASGA